MIEIVDEIKNNVEMQQRLRRLETVFPVFYDDLVTKINTLLTADEKKNTTGAEILNEYYQDMKSEFNCEILFQLKNSGFHDTDDDIINRTLNQLKSNDYPGFILYTYRKIHINKYFRNVWQDIIRLFSEQVLDVCSLT